MALADFHQSITYSFLVVGVLPVRGPVWGLMSLFADGRSLLMMSSNFYFPLKMFPMKIFPVVAISHEKYFLW